MLHKTDSGNGMTSTADMTANGRAPHGALAVSSGGYHLMGMRPSPSPKADATVPVMLEFGDHSRITSDFAVRNAVGSERRRYHGIKKNEFPRR